MGGGELQASPTLEAEGFTVAFPMPRHPLALHRWLQGWDKALTRRLRNLSHAVNVELLRFGLTRSLMPMALLDAVLEGQADAQSAPPNLLNISHTLLPWPPPRRLIVCPVGAAKPTTKGRAPAE